MRVTNMQKVRLLLRIIVLYPVARPKSRSGRGRVTVLQDAERSKLQLTDCFDL